MVERDSEDIKSKKRQLDIIRRERDSILRLLNQARLANLNKEVENLIQEFDRLDAVLSEEDSYWVIIDSFIGKLVFSSKAVVLNPDSKLREVAVSLGWEIDDSRVTV